MKFIGTVRRGPRTNRLGFGGVVLMLSWMLDHFPAFFTISVYTWRKMTAYLSKL